MSVEENLRVYDATTKALNNRDLDRFESYHLNSVIQRDPTNAEPIKGTKAIRSSIESFIKAFPDIRMTTERSFGAGDWISVQGHIAGKNTAPLELPGGPAVPATNRSIRLPLALIARLEGGKFAEINVYWDTMSMMAQLGLAPQTPPEPKR